MKRTANHPDHPDLARMTDGQLSQELDYCFRQINNAHTRLQKALFALKNDQQPTLPTWALREDLSFHLDRFEAVSDEIRYRKDAMI